MDNFFDNMIDDMKTMFDEMAEVADEEKCCGTCIHMGGDRYNNPDNTINLEFKCAKGHEINSDKPTKCSDFSNPLFDAIGANK